MTDRLTDAELDEAARHANAVAAHVSKEGVLGPRELVVADLLLLADRVVTYADELRKHRAALASGLLAPPSYNDGLRDTHDSPEQGRPLRVAARALVALTVTLSAAASPPAASDG